MGQSVSGVGNKECTSADNFNTIIKPMKSLPTFYYNYMEIYVNNKKNSPKKIIFFRKLAFSSMSAK